MKNVPSLAVLHDEETDEAHGDESPEERSPFHLVLLLSESDLRRETTAEQETEDVLYQSTENQLHSRREDHVSYRDSVPGRVKEGTDSSSARVDYSHEQNTESERRFCNSLVIGERVSPSEHRDGE